jgi:hypothetical protein
MTRAYKALLSQPMKSFQTYPLHSQATAGLQCAGMFMRIGKSGMELGAGVRNTRPGYAGENNFTKEAGR